MVGQPTVVYRVVLKCEMCGRQVGDDEGITIPLPSAPVKVPRGTRCDTCGSTWVAAGMPRRVRIVPIIDIRTDENRPRSGRPSRWLVAERARLKAEQAACIE